MLHSVIAGYFSLLQASLLLLVWWNRYAKDLVNIMYGVNGPDFGAASDGMWRVGILFNGLNVSVLSCISKMFVYASVKPPSDVWILCMVLSRS